MPFVAAEDGVRIYYELDGAEGALPLVLHHGFGGNLDDWREHGYVQCLRERFRLILLDGRGHGRSDRPRRQQDYDFRTRVLDVVSVLREAGHERAHFFGYSLGGTIGLSALIYAPQRFTSMFLGGASPYGGEDLVMKRVGFERSWELLGTWPYNTDREALHAHFDEQMRFEGAIQALQTTRVPALLYAGELDKGPHRGITRLAEHLEIPRFTLEGRDHTSTFRNPDAVEAVVARLIEFIEGVEATSK